MAGAPFPIDPVLTGIALAYRNAALIAELVLPPTDPMMKQEFTFKKWTLEEGFTVPETEVGRKSTPNEVEFTGVEVNDKVVDNGLDDLIPFDDMQNARDSLDPLGRAVVGLTDLIALRREKRTADLVFLAATYDTNLKVQLSGTGQWSDFANSDPIADIQAAIDGPIMTPNIGVFGRQSWSVLIRHPEMLKAVNRTAGDTGIARREDVQALFELDEILVGSARLNTAKKGQTPSYARVWGKHAAFLHRDPLATDPMANRVTFGWTAQYGEKVSGQLDEPKTGMRGSTRVRVGESVKEVIVANETGYFVEDAVA